MSSQSSPASAIVNNDVAFLMLLIKECELKNLAGLCSKAGKKLGVSGESLRQKFYKLKRESDKLFDNDGTNGSAPNGKTAPKTPRTKTTDTGGTTGKGRKRAADIETDVEINGTPMKAKSNGGRSKKLKTEETSEVMEVVKIDDEGLEDELGEEVDYGDGNISVEDEV